MKTCPYCGKEYSDDILNCVVDQSPLVISETKTSISIEAAKSVKRPGPISPRAILPIGGFAILAGLFGFGLTWLAVGFYAKVTFKTSNDQIDFAAKSMPVLIAGGIIGFIVGLFASVSVARADPKTEERIETKYVGAGGRMRIYMGAPIFIIALLSRFFETLLDRVGATVGVYIALGIALIIVTIGLILYDRIPPKHIIPIGIIGWMLTLLMVLWFGFFRTGTV